MHFLISFPTLSACSDYLEGRWHLRHNPQGHHESDTGTQHWDNFHGENAELGMVFHPSPKTGCLELGLSRSHTEEQERQKLPQGLVCEKGSLSACERARTQ